MQIEKLKTQPSFQPIELKITIESPEELRTLYGALDTTDKEKKSGSKSFPPSIGCSYVYIQNLFDTLHYIAKERGYTE